MYSNGVDNGGTVVDTLDESRDVLFEVLADVNRRFVLLYLDAKSRPVPVHELADSLASWAEIPAWRARMSLHHAHLPKLESVGYIAYEDAVYLREKAQRAVELLRNY